ncbi:MAG: GAF domain-containing protein, partial [Nocardioidaceae bacterium]
MWTDYLELLARDASTVEYDGPVLAARAEGESEEVVGQLEQGKRLALEIRESLLGRRRREDELTALSDTAYDLARLSDLDAVLDAIVHRARQLLRTDVAYLSMNDPDRGDTYMRVTDGSVSARFQEVRLAMGEGLGGKVAQNAMPYSTPSYFGDEQFAHTAPIDDAVADEGLVAILGVPLQLGSHVIGVLYAANRSERGIADMLAWVLRHELEAPGEILEQADAQVACDVLLGVARTDQRERSSIFSATAGVLALYNSDSARRAASNPNFDPERFAASTDTIYITAPAHRQALCAPLVVGLLEQIRHATYR